MAKAKKIILCVIVAVILLPLIRIGACVVREKRYERGYAQIEPGDSKKDVVELLGEPGEVLGCSGPVYYNGRVTGECAEEYGYYTFLEEWWIILDKDGKVLVKSYSVSG
jgi:hypothetical protein